MAAAADIKKLEQDWADNPRWQHVRRDYSAEDVVRLGGSVQIEHTLARRGAEKLWQLLNNEDYIHCLGTLTGGQAVQQVKAGVKAIYLSGWQVAADANTSETMYPDQSLYAVDSVPAVVRRINNALKRADQIQWARGSHDIDFFAPIVADAEAGFGGVLNAYELMKGMIEAGAAGVHFEDQLAAVKKCGHMGGKVLVPTREAVQKLTAARLAADSMGVPTVLLARTDANAANLLTSDVDEYDAPFITGVRTTEGFYETRAGLEQAIARGLAYAPYADLLYLDDATIARFQRELGAMGYKYQFITLAGIHNMWYNMFDLAHAYVEKGMTAYVEMVQEKEFAASDRGYTFASHQQEVGAGYFDAVTTVIQGGQSSVTALAGSTEEAQFAEVAAK